MNDISTDDQAQAAEQPGSKQRRNGIQLSELYPKAKTYEERLADQNDREERRLKRLPRHLTLSVGTRLFVVVTLAVLLFTVAPTIVTWNVISGTFNLVLCTLALIAIAKWQIGEASSALYNKGLNNTAFLTLHLTILAPLTALAQYYANQQTETVGILPIHILIFLAHLLGVQALLRLSAQ